MTAVLTLAGDDLEAERLEAAAGEVTLWPRRVLEGDLLELRVLRVEGAKLVEIEGERSGAERAVERVDHPPYPPEDFSPRPQFALQRAKKVVDVEVVVPETNKMVFTLRFFSKVRSSSNLL